MKCLAGNATKGELPFIIEFVRLFYARHGTADLLSRARRCRHSRAIADELSVIIYIFPEVVIVTEGEDVLVVIQGEEVVEAITAIECLAHHFGWRQVIDRPSLCISDIRLAHSLYSDSKSEMSSLSATFSIEYPLDIRGRVPKVQFAIVAEIYHDTELVIVTEI